MTLLHSSLCFCFTYFVIFNNMSIFFLTSQDLFVNIVMLFFTENTYLFSPVKHSPFTEHAIYLTRLIFIIKMILSQGSQVFPSTVPI